jgi:hypothetical protein
VGQQPETEADQELGDEAQDDSTAHEGQHAEDQNNAVRRHSQRVSEQPEHSRSAQDGDHVQKVVGRHQPPFFPIAAALLQQRVQRHREEPSEKAHQCQAGRSRREGGRAARQHNRRHPHPDRSDRHQPKLHLVPREPTRDKAADTDTDCGERRERSDPAVVELHHLRAKQHHHELQQGTDEPEVRNARDGQPQHAVAAQSLQPGADFRPWIEPDRRAWSGRRDLRNAEAAGGTDDRNDQHRHANDPQVVLPEIEREAADGRAGDNRNERTHFENAVGARQIAFGKYLGQNPILRRAEERRLKRNQEQHSEHDLEPASHEGKEPQ